MRLRAAQGALVAGFGKHDGGIADLEFCMSDLAVRGGQPEHFNGAKGFFVELDGFTCAFDSKVRGNAVLAFWNGFDCHFSFLL
ncbi:hypothetical protein D9M71_468540 [compost metagenome]